GSVAVSPPLIVGARADHVHAIDEPPHRRSLRVEALPGFGRLLEAVIAPECPLAYDNGGHSEDAKRERFIIGAAQGVLHILLLNRLAQLLGILARTPARLEHHLELAQVCALEEGEPHGYEREALQPVLAGRYAVRLAGRDARGRRARGGHRSERARDVQVVGRPPLRPMDGAEPARRGACLAVGDPARALLG